MKKKYTSLRNACHKTNIHWSQFHKCTKLKSNVILRNKQKKYIRKLATDEIKSIEKYFICEDVSFPLPDKNIQESGS